MSSIERTIVVMIRRCLRHLDRYARARILAASRMRPSSRAVALKGAAFSFAILICLPTLIGQTLLRFPNTHGDQVVFDAHNNLWMANLSGGHARQLTSGLAHDLMPRFSPDGRWVAFTRTSQGGVRGMGNDPALLDGGRITIPHDALYGADGEWLIENVGVQPDLDVEEPIGDTESDSDPQLNATITVLLQSLSTPAQIAHPAKLPAYSAQATYPQVSSEEASVLMGACHGSGFRPRSGPTYRTYEDGL